MSTENVVSNTDSNESEALNQNARDSEPHQSSRHESSAGTSSKADEKNSKWIRLIYMILFLVIFAAVEAALFLTTCICFATHLLKDKPLPQAVGFGEILSTYAAKIIAFLTYSKESPPWPFEPMS